MRVFDLAAISTETRLPEPPDGWFDNRFAVLMDGNLAIVRTDVDFHTEYLRWREQRVENPEAAAPALRRGRLRLSVFDGIAEGDTVEITSCPNPIVSRLADGRWLLAGVQCEQDDENVRLYNSDGSLSAKFSLGEGIQYIFCSPDNTIWVGYFDQGVFAAQSDSGKWPVSSGGIVRFSSDGVVLWSYNDKDHGSGPVDDCYALTLDGTVAFSCFYSDFPIVAMDGAVVSVWKNKITGAHALAVDRDHMLLCGGYGVDAQRVALVKLGNEKAKLIHALRAPPINSDAVNMMQGLGETLHIVADGRWLRLTVNAVKEFLSKVHK